MPSSCRGTIFGCFELCEDLGFFNKALVQVRTVLADYLQCDMATERGVSHQVNLAHAAYTQAANEPRTGFLPLAAAGHPPRR